MEQILDLPVNTERTLKYAGFWIRVVAYIIDSIVLSVANVALASVFLGTLSVLGNMETMILYYAISLIASVVYFCAMESSSKQGTLGKMAVGIKVGNFNGEQISFLNSLGRYLGKIFLPVFTLMISLMWAGWDAKKQALHDKLASTYVYYG